jgi:hypothetical protein
LILAKFRKVFFFFSGCFFKRRLTNSKLGFVPLHADLPEP